MDIISELKWILVKRENQKSIIVDREFQDYPPGSVITTDKGTLGKFWSILALLRTDTITGRVGLGEFGQIWVGFGSTAFFRTSGVKFKHAICLRAF